MKEMLMGVVGGMGLLIFAYLLFANKSASIGLLNASFSGTNTLTKTLKGR